MRKLLEIAAATCLLLAGATMAHAQTADGMTPAEETVCHDANLTGAAFGLCNAYCEAMDCHLYAEGGQANASQNACDKVKANFQKHEGENAELPCESGPPPAACETDEDCDGGLMCVVDGETGVGMCKDNGGGEPPA